MILKVFSAGKGEGKTSFLLKYIRRMAMDKRSVGGIASPALFEGEKRIGYELVDLRQGTRRLLAQVRPPGDGDRNPGTYKFESEAVEAGNTAIISSVRDKLDVIAIDEVGPLEFRGEGWAASLEFALQECNLEQELIGLSATIDKAEARILAETAVRESAVLAEEYQLVRPAVAHNLLVVFGIRDRGLCYHWTEDLMKRLQALDLESVQLHWGVAYRGSELREHNCVVVTAREQSFFKGIVLDPWRNSGNLYWAVVSKDSYPWETLPPSDW